MINETTSSQILRGESEGNFGAGGAHRVIGLLYLVLGVLLAGTGWLLSENPGIFNAASPRYEPPHACVCLECKHGYMHDPNGELYCAKFPPKKVLDAQMSASTKRTRLILGAGFGIVGLFFVVLKIVCGFLWLFGLWTTRKRARWCTIACWAAPVLAFFCWIAACVLKSIYPVTPL